MYKGILVLMGPVTSLKCKNTVFFWQFVSIFWAFFQSLTIQNQVSAPDCSFLEITLLEYEGYHPESVAFQFYYEDCHKKVICKCKNLKFCDKLPVLMFLFDLSKTWI